MLTALNTYCSRIIVGGADGSLTFLVVAENESDSEVARSLKLLRSLPSRLDKISSDKESSSVMPVKRLYRRDPIIRFRSKFTCTVFCQRSFNSN